MKILLNILFIGVLYMSQTDAINTEVAQEVKEITTASGLKIKHTKEGEGNFPEKGNTVSVHYTGTLENGTKFDSSHDRGQPIQFKLGVGQVIPGWDEGIALIKKGGKAILTIPSDLGYGPMSIGSIPANSTLVFDVELVDIK